MRTIPRDRLLYAGLTFLLVIGTYAWTIAPTLTFWDAGEFIAASYILGIPHPPGTPLFVLLGHVFGMLPLGVGFAVKTNLMSALASSAAAFFYFLVVAQVVGRIDRDRGWGLPSWLVNLGALGAVCLAAWGLSIWYNSTETEVYTVAHMTIALVTFLTFYWADHLEEGKDWNLLLLIVFLVGLSIGNHLMALLVMPAVVVYALMVTWDSHRDYLLSLLVGAFGLYVTVMRGISVDGILAGTDPIHTGAMLFGLAVLAAGLWWMSRTGALLFFGAAILCFLAGASVLLVLKIRAGLDPAINEANPRTWLELLAVLARKQYDVRPIFPRAVDVFQYQVPLYFDYLFGQIGPFQSRVSSQFGLPGLSVIVFLMAIVGSVYHYLADRKTWVFFLIVYLTTSAGLILYLNFPLGNSQALDVNAAEVVNLEVAPQGREVREREYFFLISYVFLGLWAGIGLFSLAGDLWRKATARAAELRPPRGAAAAGMAFLILIVPISVFALNYREANRRGNYIPNDFAYNLLQSVEPWAILFTNGDNDTFPLWYLQEVEGVRTDVAVVNLALLNTIWYVEQLSTKSFTATHPPEGVPGIPLDEHASFSPVPRPEQPILDYDGTPGHPLARIGYVVEEPTTVDVAGIPVSLPGNSILRRQDLGVLQVVTRHLGRRPIYFSVTVPEDAKVHMHDHIVRQGVADRLLERRADDLARAGRVFLPMQPPETAWIDVERTEVLLNQVYRYRGLDDPGVYKDGTARALIGNYGATYLQLAAAQARRGETEQAIRSLERGNEILGRDADDPNYLSSLINVYAVSGDGPRLDSLFRSVRERSGTPLDDRFYKSAAYNAAVVGHYDVALSLLQRHFRDRPQAVEPDLYVEMGEMAIAWGDSLRALDFMEAAIAADPDHRRAFLRHINLAVDMGNDVMAKTFMYQWVRTHPGDTATGRLYEQYLDTGELPEELKWETLARRMEGAGVDAPAPVDTAPGAR